MRSAITIIAIFRFPCFLVVSLHIHIAALKRIVAAVSKVSGVKEEELGCPQRSEIAQRSREMVSYVSRRHSDVGLGELAKFLQVKELSTPSHGVRRAEERLANDRTFRRQMEQVLKILDRSSMQA